MRNCTSAALGKRQIVHAMGSTAAWSRLFLPLQSLRLTDLCFPQTLSQCHWSLPNSKPGKKHFRAESCRFQSLPPLPCCSRWYYHSTAPRAADNTETDLHSRHPQQALMVFHCQLWPGAGCVGAGGCEQEQRCHWRHWFFSNTGRLRNLCVHGDWPAGPCII